MIDNNFLSIECFQAYKDLYQLACNNNPNEMMDQFQDIISDLKYWIYASEKILLYYRSRY